MRCLVQGWCFALSLAREVGWTVGIPVVLLLFLCFVGMGKVLCAWESAWLLYGYVRHEQSSINYQTLTVTFPLPCDGSTALRRGAANGGAGNAADKSCLSGPINEGMSSQLRCLRRKTIARRLMEEISCISRVL